MSSIGTWNACCWPSQPQLRRKNPAAQPTRNRPVKTNAAPQLSASVSIFADWPCTRPTKEQIESAISVKNCLQLMANEISTVIAHQLGSNLVSQFSLWWFPVRFVDERVPLCPKDRFEKQLSSTFQQSFPSFRILNFDNRNRTELVTSLHATGSV